MKQEKTGSGKRIVWGAPDDVRKDQNIMAFTPEKRAEIIRLLNRSDLTAEEISHVTGISSSVVAQVLGDVTSESRHPETRSV